MVIRRFDTVVKCTPDAKILTYSSLAGTKIHAIGLNAVYLKVDADLIGELLYLVHFWVEERHSDLSLA